MKSPKPKNKNFTHYWNKFYPTLEQRGHIEEINIKNLQVICDLCTEYDELVEIIEEEGRIFESVTKYGIVKKLNPAVNQKNTCVVHLLNYSKLLGFDLSKNKAIKEDNGEEEDEWS